MKGGEFVFDYVHLFYFQLFSRNGSFLTRIFLALISYILRNGTFSYCIEGKL